MSDPSSYSVSSDQRDPEAAAGKPEVAALSRELEAQKRLNRELTALIDQLRHDIRILFASWTWRVGYMAAQVARRLMFWRNRSLDQRHWTRQHFDDLLAASPAYGAGRRRGAQAEESGFVDVDLGIQHRMEVDVETVMRDTWRSVAAADADDGAAER